MSTGEKRLRFARGGIIPGGRSDDDSALILLDTSYVIPAAMIDLSDCQHGCNGDCVASGSDVCTWLCHPGLTP